MIEALQRALMITSIAALCAGVWAGFMGVFFYLFMKDGGIDSAEIFMLKVLWFVPFVAISISINHGDMLQ